MCQFVGFLSLGHTLKYGWKPPQEIDGDKTCAQACTSTTCSFDCTTESEIMCAPDPATGLLEPIEPAGSVEVFGPGVTRTRVESIRTRPKGLKFKIPRGVLAAPTAPKP